MTDLANNLGYYCRNEMKMICVLPHDVQENIDLTINYKPLIENMKDKNLPCEVHFGKRPDDEI